MASGGSPAEFDPIFWRIDYGLWGVRALIEAWVIIYCFSTQTKRWWETVGLGIVEVALIALIFATLGPALRALTLRQPITEILNDQELIWWTYGIAGYTSLMMAGVGFAYKIQPYDEVLVPVAEVEAVRVAHAATETQLNTANEELTQRQSLLDKAQEMVAGLQAQVASLTVQLEQAATGISQDVFETMQSQLTMAQAEVEQVKENWQNAMRQVEAKTTQLESAQALVKSMTSRLQNIGGEFTTWWASAEIGQRASFLLDNLVGPPYPRPIELAAALGVQPAQIFPVYNEWRNARSIHEEA